MNERIDEVREPTILIKSLKLGTIMPIPVIPRTIKDLEKNILVS